MNRDQARRLMEALSKEISHHNQLYYGDDRPIISDEEYDQLVARLKDLEEAYPDVASHSSPLQEVGVRPGSVLSTVTFERPVLSLGNVHNQGELEEFNRRVHQQLGISDPLEYTVELKIDGLSIVVDYEDGRLRRAATRGDGTVGEDVTANVRGIDAVPHQLTEPVTGQFRGEVFMARSVFAEINHQREASGLALFANPRNAAAGSLRQLDPQVTKARRLSAYFYEVRNVVNHPMPQSQHEALERLAQWGFPVEPHYQVYATVDGIMQYILTWDDLQVRRQIVDFDIDGLVIKLDQMKWQRQLGNTQKAPRWAMAYKFAPQEALTRVRAITLSVGRTGVLTPTAELDPVVLAGTTVSRASLHNADIIQSLDVRVGDYVFVRKAGEIIPEVVRVDRELRDDSLKPFAFPPVCPSCGSEVVRLPEESAYRCSGGLQCPAQVREGLIHFVSRNAMDIDGLGEKTIDVLLEHGRIQTVADLYRLTPDSFVDLPRFGPVLIAKILKSIADSKERPLARLLFGLGIRYVGEKVAKTLADHYQSMENLRQADLLTLQHVEDVGIRIAQSVRTFFEEPKNLAVIDELERLGVNMLQPSTEQEGPHKILIGKTVVITGSFDQMTRTEFERFLQTHGARVTGSVSSRTDLVIVGQNPGSKLERARQLNLRILTEKELYEELARSG